MFISLENFHVLFDKINDYLASRGYEIVFKNKHFLENLIYLFNESLEKGDIEHLRSIQFQFLILLDKGVIKELNHNLFADFSLVFYYDNDALMSRFSSPRIADIFHSKRIHKLNIFITFTRKVKNPVIEKFLIDSNIEYSKPVKSRINIEIELKNVEVIKYLI
jgi:hypothetical protein